MNIDKRVFGVVASPRNLGNTAILVKEVLRGANDKGCEIDYKCLGDLDIKPLQACATDKPYGVTGSIDDMNVICESIEKMNVFVFGTPIYYDHVSARAKIFIDRLIYYSKDSTRELFPPNVHAVIIITYEWDKLEAYSSVIAWIKETLEHYWKMKVVATLQAENTVKNPMHKRKDLLQKAYKIGRNL